MQRLPTTGVAQHAGHMLLPRRMSWHGHDDVDHHDADVLPWQRQRKPPPAGTPTNARAARASLSDVCDPQAHQS